MRTVSIEQFQALKDAWAAMGTKSEHLGALMLETAAKVEAMAAAGDVKQAQELAAATEAHGLTELTGMRATFELAAVEFLGERRHVLETPEAYTARIIDVLGTGDVAAIFEMQHRNGVRFA
jgi:hypothetical protein